MVNVHSDDIGQWKEQIDKNGNDKIRKSWSRQRNLKTVEQPEKKLKVLIVEIRLKRARSLKEISLTLVLLKTILKKLKLEPRWQTTLLKE